MKKQYECYTKINKRWRFIGWSPIDEEIVRQDSKYWFTKSYRYRKPTK